MTFDEIIKLAQSDARQRFGQPPQQAESNPVEMLTGVMQKMDGDAKPYWLYDDKKDNNHADTSWGPPSPLGSGSAGERTGGQVYSALYGGV